MLKRIKRILLLCIIVLISMGIGCSKPEEKELVEKTPEKDVEVIKLKDLYSFKLPFLPSEILVNQYIDSNQTVDNYFKMFDEVDMQARSSYVKVLTKQEAIEDIENYFRYLKDGYAGYLANGGDESFLKAKASVIDSLEDEMDSTKLSGLLEDAMSFVDDAHFIIGKQDTISRSKKWYYVEGLQIGENDQGYFNLKTEELIENKEEIEPFLKPSLSKDGELFFMLAAFEEEIEEVPKEIVYSDDSKLVINFSEISGQKNRDINPVYTSEGIPYLHIKQFYNPNETEKIELTLNAAKEMSEASIAILDLRGNLGGNGILVRQWIEAYTGEKFQTSANTVSILSEKLFEGDDSNGQTWEEYIEVFDEEIYDENHTLETASSNIVEKDNKLIVLTDAHTGSAAESVVDSLHHLDNTLFIGMPTLGSSSGSLLFTAIFPNSKIAFGFGNSWSEFNEEYYQEFNGFKPDIWVPYVDEDKMKEYLNSF